MRRLDKAFEDKFNNDNEFKPIINYVKNHKDVFLGVRNNLIDLYVNGGCFFSIKKVSDDYMGYFNIKGYGKYLDPSISPIVKQLSMSPLKNNIDEWINIMDDLKGTVAMYKKGHYRGNSGKVVVDREKILQQKLALEINNSDSKYYTYDIEYNIEGLKEYVFDVDTKIIAKGIKPQELGRLDNMVIEIKDDNKVYIYLMEVKEGLGAISPISKKTKLYGQGIIGHVNSYMKIIDKVKSGEKFISHYLEDKRKEFEFDFRERLMEEIKYIMSFYQKIDLINNRNFKNIDYDKLEFGDIELVFYLGGYNLESKKLENHLGLSGNQADSVVNLINRDYRPMQYDYINKDQIYDFKYYKDKKNYNAKLMPVDLDIKNYNQVKVKMENGKIKLYE